jgi:hypothetical protein
MAFNSDLEKADDYFNDRKNINSLNKAKKIYENIINKTKNKEEKIYAFDRYARLTFLEAQLAPYIWGTPVKNASSLFERSIDLSAKISKESLGYETPEYVYWRAVFIGLWASTASKLALTFKSYLIFDMINLIKTGLQKYPNFDDGGFYLLQAGIKIRSRALKIIKIYNPEEAIILLDKTRNNYTSYLLKAEAQYALSLKNEAKNTLETGILNLEENLASKNINSLSELESLATLYLLKESLRTMNFSSYELHKL